MKTRSGFVSNSSSTSFLLCMPHRFDILSLGITPEELAAEQIGLDEVFGAVAELMGQGNLAEDSTAYQFLLNKLTPYIVFDFGGGPDDGAMYLLTDAAKCKLATLLIQEGLVDSTEPSSQIAEEYGQTIVP